MYCSNCGKNIPEASKYCRYCGRQLQRISVESLNSIENREQELTADDFKRKRNNWIGWVLIIFSLLGFVGIALTSTETTAATGETLDSFGSSPVPYLIDFILGILLLRQKDKYLSWVFLRAIIGLVLWGLLAAAYQEWGTLVAQLVYILYYIYYIKAPLTERSFKVANYIILPIAIISLFFV